MIRTQQLLWSLFSILILCMACDSSSGNVEKKHNNGDENTHKIVYLDARFKQPFDAQGDQTFLHINSTAAWTLSIPDDAKSWIQIDEQAQGQGPTSLTLHIQKNKSKKERCAELKVEIAGDKTYSVKVCQAFDGSSTDQPQGILGSKLEIPRLADIPNGKFVAHYVKYGGKEVMNFCFQYDIDKRHPVWVAFRFDAITSAKNTGRSDAWDCDPELDFDCKGATFWPFQGHRVDRGHLVASSDRLFSKKANQQTFYYSNISPQYSYFNQRIWSELEQKVQSWGRSRSLCDTLYVVKGGTILGSSSTLGYANNKAGGKSVVPKEYFMALLQVKDGKYNAIGFLLPHKEFSASDKNLAPYKLNIDQLEDKTGLDFFANLPDDTENSVEQKVDIRKWPGL